ncbi:hypothetical protein M409DRAFT_23636 [Zasmidium cellare ATCC 36951]|uniref:DUF7702 domain-containing protein n=1 Tax=Zasmidium cellare ATCC 36951 TaxID=1080233 RepID=A0A6A6CFB4_ZASCE|nr:uncharacterized protein M409DRAFT_23636 [Zasmidium cellare ATCC 36951]KAF2165904.1 hypothetical protein M409DRAFT_23636 [Zasmidium cellare ATCC 36951]
MENRNIVAVLVILFYSPTFLCTCWLIWKHGWRASSETWFVLSTFAISRIIFGALQLSTISYPQTTGLRVAAATFSVDGLSALLFCALGLLHRLLNTFHEQRCSVWLTIKHLRFLELAVTAAFICASVGFSGLHAKDLETTIHHPPTSKAAAALYIVGVAGIFYSVGILLLHARTAEKQDRDILWTLAITQPLLVERVTYLCLDMLGNIRVFSTINGSVTAFLCMGLLEEAAVMIAYMRLGFVLLGHPSGVPAGAVELEEAPKGEDRADYAQINHGEP